MLLKAETGNSSGGTCIDHLTFSTVLLPDVSSERYQVIVESKI